MAAPLMQFQSYNPMETALKAALSTYQGLGQGRQQHQENARREIEAPYWGQNAQNDALIKQIEAQYAQPTAQAGLENTQANTQMTRKQIDWYDEIQRTDIAYKMAQMEEKKNPAAPKITTGISGMMIARDQALAEGREADAAILQRDIDATLANKEGLPYRSGPMDAKRATLAQLVGLGRDQSQAMIDLGEGKTVEQVADEMGIPRDKIKNYIPSYNPTQPNITGAKNREVGAIELNTLQPHVNEGMGEFISGMPINGYSPEQALQMASGMNPERQIKFLAAHMAVPDLILLRLRALGSEVSHAQYKELEGRLIGTRKAFERGLTPEIYQAANNLHNEWLIEAGRAANQAMYAPHSEVKMLDQPVTKALDTKKLKEKGKGLTREEIAAIARGEG